MFKPTAVQTLRFNQPLPRGGGLTRRSARMAGHLYEVKPRKLKSSHGADRWVFASYLEFPSQREDGQFFRAYLFRNLEWTVFGALAVSGEKGPKLDPRDWATKIVIDQEYRRQHLTEDVALIRLWKNR